MAARRLPYSSAVILLVILLASAAALVAGTPPCPAGWSEGGFWCYLLNGTSTLSWAGAQALCSERNGQLVELPDRAHLLDVLDLVRANHVPDWWIGIKRTSDATHEQVLSANNLFDNFGEDKVSPSSNSGSTYQCVYLSGRDGLWHWKSCDTAMHFICQRPATRVPIQLVSPERLRPNADWLAAHARGIEATLHQARLSSSSDDDKGVFSQSKATATPIPSTTTTRTSPVEVVTSSGGSPTEATTVSLCQGRHWLMLDVACYQLILDAMNWTMASEQCRQQGGQLATFSSADIQRSFVARFSHNSGSIWVGLRRDADGEVSWVDGSTPSFSGWPAGQSLSTAPAASCGALTLHTGDWSNQDCSAYKPFACRRSLDATSMATTPTTAPTTTAPSLCGDGGWWQYRQWCFLVVTDMPAVSWHGAQLDCRRRLANLAKIESSAQNANIFHRVTQSNLPVWIGLTRRVPPHQYVWTDGAAASFTTWEHGHNNVADLSSCARMDNEHGSWRAVNCNSPQYYVCQKPVGSPAPPPPPSPPPPAGGVCPEGWSQYGTDRCLQVSDKLADWSEARRTCRNKAPDAELVTIADPVQQAFVTAAIRHSPVHLWIGLTYIKVEHQFATWTDESAVNYTNWASGQPSNVCDDCPVTCGLLGSSRSHSPGAWSAVDCSQEFRFICQRPTVTGTNATTGQPLGTHEPTRCPPPFSNYLQDEDACLKVVRQPATWQVASAHCAADNTSLAYVGDVFDNARLMKLLYRDGGNQYWLALSDTKRYGIPQWSAPWPTEPTYANWELRQPQLASPATCAALRPDTGKWRHLSCSQPQPYVCLHRPRAQRAPPATAAHCPSPLWTASERRCYRLHTDTRTWAEAKQACEGQQQQLAVVSSKSDFLAVLEAISGLTSTFSAWIGGRQQPDTGSFVWVDGSAMTFDGWIEDEPSSQLRQETCLEASKLNSGRWNNLRCDMYRPFVCMIETSGAEESDTHTSRLAGGGSSGGGGGGGGTGWRVFGIICLAVTVVAVLTGAVVWVVRRRLAAPHHRRLSSASAQQPFHDHENPAYCDSEQPLEESASDDDGDASGLNGGRWRALDNRQPQEVHPL